MKRPSRSTVLLVLLLGVLGGILLAPFALRAAGRFLVIADPLEPSDAIVVMAGEIPFRQMAAARLYQRGLAPRVVLTRESDRAGRRKLKELGLALPDLHDLAAKVLQRLHVPPGAIEVVGEPTLNTAEELAAIRRFALRQGYGHVIIVSSPDHMRRIRTIWHRLEGSPLEARLLPASEEDGFDPDHWWTSRVGAERLVHEYFGIVNFLLGSPIRGG